MRFEFKVQMEDGSEFWTPLQGSGGLHGDGCLHLDIAGLDEEKRQRLFRKILARAKAELAIEGCVRIFKGDHLPPRDRIEPLMAEEVLEVRFVGAVR